jgi:hypothetical protein
MRLKNNTELLDTIQISSGASVSLDRLDWKVASSDASVIVINDTEQ